MSDTLRQFEKFKKQVTRLQRERDRVAGGLEQHLAKLKKDFGCNNLEEAKVLLTKLTKQRDEAENILRKTMGKFERKWKHVLEADGSRAEEM